MVLVFNLDEESCESDPSTTTLVCKPQAQLNSATLAAWTRKPLINYSTSDRERKVENVGSFSAALACYPVVSQIAQDLDLNTLDNLSRTCHLFQALLRTHRKSLIALAMRCSNDERAGSTGSRGTQSTDDPTNTYYSMQRRVPCATDLVGECRRCGIIVCRNCTAKALPPAKLLKRHRRLCNTCMKAPLPMLMAPHLNSDDRAFAYSAFAKGSCECPMFFWLCQPCGQHLPAYDTDYCRIWNWRIRYSTYLGGLGTGIGEGHEGVKCGRREDCLASRKIEVEEDCSSDSVMGTPRDPVNSRPISQHSLIDGNDHDLEKAGYFRQEVEGIGGLMRGKFKKMVVVGQTVQEHEDERENGSYLSREAKGTSRSWCSWCERIIPSLKDKDSLIP